MSIDQLIRDLIEEDRFKAKYTARQRSIFCENMYTKVYNFIKVANEDAIERVEQLEEELAVAQNDLEFYKKENALLKEANAELKKNYKSIFVDIVGGFRLIIYSLYIYVMWIHYKEREDKSIKDTNSTRVVPYRMA
jgi:hypothetical protein